jgi:hypothetical protein
MEELDLPKPGVPTLCAHAQLPLLCPPTHTGEAQLGMALQWACAAVGRGVLAQDSLGTIRRPGAVRTAPTIAGVVRHGR